MKRISSRSTISIHVGVIAFFLGAICSNATSWAQSFGFETVATLAGNPQAPSLAMDGDLALVNQIFLGEAGSSSAIIGDNKVVEVFSTEVIESEEPAIFSNAVMNDNKFIAYQNDQFGPLGQSSEIRLIFPDTLGTHSTLLTGNDLRLLGMDNAQRLLVRVTENLPGGGQQTALNLYDSSGAFLETVTNEALLGTDLVDLESVFVSRNSGAISFVQRDPGFGGGQSQIMQYLPGISPAGGEIVHMVDGSVFIDEPSINVAGQVAFIEGAAGANPGTSIGELVRLFNPFDPEILSTVLAVNDFTVPGGQFVRFDEVALNNQGQIFVFGELSFGPVGNRDALAVYDIYTEEFDLVIREGQNIFGFGEITDVKWDQYGINELGSMAVIATFDDSPIDRLLTIVETGDGSGLHPLDPIGGSKTAGGSPLMIIISQPPPDSSPECVPVDLCPSSAMGPTGTGFFEGDGPPLWVDPDPEVGFQYEVSEGEPNFASIVVPEQENLGDGVFTLRFLSDTGEPVEHTIVTLERFFFTDFVPGGVANFIIDGIEFDETTTTLGQATELGFVAGLTWTSLPSDQAVITITPLITVPEPTTCTLALAALCLAMSRRRAF